MLHSEVGFYLIKIGRGEIPAVLKFLILSVQFTFVLSAR
jgi:hypothetical protein